MKFFYLCILFISFTKIYSQNILISTGGTVNVVGGEFFYDAGGAAGNDGNTSYTITLAPAVSGEKVCLDFTSFKTMFSASAEDPLYIYDGPTATGLNIGKLMGDYSIKTGNGTTPYGVGRGLANSADVNNIFKPTLFSATNSTGCLTLVFQNNSSSQNFGWVANVLTYKDLGIPGCSINLTASTNTICSGQNTVLTTTGNLVASALNNNFNGSLGTGWVGTPSATIVTNVCASPSLDGSQYLWMQNSVVPRSLESLAMDVSTGGTISFEYRQAKFNSDPSPCEAPDILMSGTTNEGIFVQYSTNNGVTWNTFKYLFSNSLYSNSGTADAYNNGCGDYVTRWTKMTYPIPTAAKTTSTKFRWIQPAGTSASTDNWGLDNVIIGSPKTFTITLKDLTNNSVLITSTLSPLSFTVNPTATTVYEAIITDGVTSCTSTQTITVSGGASPVTSFSYTNPYCANGTIANPTLAAGFTTGGTFSSTPTGLSINSSSGIVALSSSTTGTYVVTYTVPASGCGVATNSTASIIINPTPSLTVNSATICSGSTTTLTATGATTYSWNTGATTSTIATVPISTTNYTITGTTNGCSSSKTTTINVTAQPTITINTATICSGANAILNPTGATTYSWNTGATSSSLNVSPTTTTVYTVTGTTNNCSSTKTTTVNVTQTPTISASSATICSGGTATLTASGGASYTWSPGASTNTILITSPASNTNYTVIGSNGTCTSSATASVTISGALSIASNSVGICAGAAATLTASGASSFTWMPMSTNGSSVTVSPTSNTTYTILGLSGTCTGSTTVNVGVTAQPTITINTATICSGANAILNPTGATTYSWNTGATSSSLNVSPATTTVYTVTGTTNNCSSTKTTTVNVTQTPTISVSSDVTITKGSSTTLSVSGNTNSISWTPNTNLSCNTCANPIASPSITTQYCVKSKNGACESNECILVIVESDCKSNADYSTPNAFTPNGDGLNDAFCLQGWDECSTTFYIAIFDRWGEKVFDSSDPSFCWDGNYLGVPLNPAVFVFYIKAEILNVGSITKKGNITLIK